MRRAAFLTGAVAIAAAAVAATADGGSAVQPPTRIYFSSNRTSAPALFSIGRDGSGRRQLSPIPPFTPAAISPDRSQVALVTQSGLEVVGVDGSGARPLTTEANDISPVWSPDGSSIAYVAGSRAAVVPAAGGTPRVFELVTPGGSPVWSPDGSEIAYGTFTPGVAIHVAAVDGSSIRSVGAFPNVVGGPALVWAPGNEILATARETIYSVDPAGGRQPVPLTHTIAYAPLPSPDGTRIAFLDEREQEGHPQPWVMNADGSGQTRLSTEPYGPVAWSPDGTQLAVLPFGSVAAALPDQVALLATDGSGKLKTLTREAPGTNFQLVSWSADGSRVLYIAQDGEFDLYSMRPGGTGLRRLTPRDGAYDEDPAVSPDGRRVAFDRYSSAPGLYLMRSGGGGTTRLTRSQDVEPAWSPDGTRLAFIRSTPGGSRSLHVLDLRTHSVRRLVSPVDEAASPTWSSTGWIAYVADGRIRAVRPDGSGRHVVVQGQSPAWSPGGRLLAYVGGSDSALIVMDTRTKRRRIIAHASDRAAWSPDGRRLAYSRGGDLFSVTAAGGRRLRLQHGFGLSVQPAWGVAP